jgi:hypothetical protein
MSHVLARVRHRWFIWVNFRPHWWDHLAECPPGKHSDPGHQDRRCTWCGHRRAFTEADPEPRQTRELPAVLWPFEIAGRIEAVLRGYLARKGKL